MSSTQKGIGTVVVDARGSYREAGRLYGERFGEAIREQVARYVPFWRALGLAEESVARRAREELLPATQELYPDYVDELRGRAEGARLCFECLLPLNCLEEVFSWVSPEVVRNLSLAGADVGLEHCTSIALRGKGQSILAHNEDWISIDATTPVIMHDITVPGGTRILSLQLVGLLPWGGLNSYGIAVTANTLPTNDARPGAANAFILRSLLECRTLEEVWERVRVPQRGLGTYVLAGDHTGRVWAMETSAQRASRRCVDAFTVQTNHFTQPSMEQFRVEPVSANSLSRIARADSLVREGVAAKEDLQTLARRVLIDHQTACGRAICGHPDPSPDALLQMATVSSVLYEPMAGRVRASVGPACRGSMRTFSMITGTEVRQQDEKE